MSPAGALAEIDALEASMAREFSPTLRRFQKRYDRAVQEAESVYPHLGANSEGQPMA